MTTPNGLLEQLADAAEYLGSLRSTEELRRLTTDSPNPATAWATVTGTIPVTWQWVSALRLVQSLGADDVLAANRLEQTEADRRETLARLDADARDDEGAVKSDGTSRLRQVLGFLLDLSPDRLDHPHPTVDGRTAWTARDRADLAESLTEVVGELDRLERAVNGRGAWPR